MVNPRLKKLFEFPLRVEEWQREEVRKLFRLFDTFVETEAAFARYALFVGTQEIKRRLLTKKSHEVLAEVFEERRRFASLAERGGKFKCVAARVRLAA